MLIRKLGDAGAFRDYTDPDGFCAWCEAGQHVAWEEAGNVVFFENDTGDVQRLECVSPGSPVMLLCAESSREAAELEIERSRRA